METGVLGADEILSGRCILGDLELELRHAVDAPGVLGEIGTFVADGLFPDLEPIAIALVLLDAARSLGHVCKRNL